MLDSSIDDKILKALITTAEDSYLQRVLSTTLYEKLKYNVAHGTLTVKQQYLGDNKILKYLLAIIQYISIDDLILKYSQNGAYISTPNNTAQADIQRLERIQFNKQKDVNTYETLIREYIEDNILDFPEFEDKTGIAAKKVRTFGFYCDDDNDVIDALYNRKVGKSDFDESL
jgi:hypothetical protein